MVRVKLNRSQMAGLMASDQMRPPLRAIAEQFATNARALAPVDTGEYRDSINVVDAMHTPPSKRGTGIHAAVDVESRHPLAVVIESRHGVLKRAMRG